MAGLIVRGNTYYAVFLSAGREMRVSTKVHVKPTAADGKMTARGLRRLAEAEANKIQAQRTTQASVAGALQNTAFSALAAGATPAEIAAAAKELLRMAGAGAVTVGEYAEQFAARTYTAASGGQKTRANRRASVNALFRAVPGWRQKSMSDITSAMAEDAVDKDLQFVSGSTVDRHVHDWSAMFNRAVREGLISSNPFKGLRLPDWALQEEVKRRAFTAEELAEVLRFPGEWPDMVRVCLMLGGKRLGDVGLLTWSQWDRDNSRLFLTTQKDNKRMTVPVITPLKKLLERRKALQGDVSPYVFPYAAARYYQSGNTHKLSNEFSSLLKKAGIGRAAGDKRAKCQRVQNEVCFHALRTTATTYLLDIGCPPPLVQLLVGHLDPDIEREHYYSPTAETKGNYLLKLADLLGEEAAEG